MEKSHIAFAPISHPRLVSGILFFNLRNLIQEVSTGILRNLFSKNYQTPAGHSLLLVTWFPFSVHNHWMGFTDWQIAQSKDRCYFRY